MVSKAYWLKVGTMDGKTTGVRKVINSNFTKAYPDYDFEGLQKYALSKGVSLIAHNETGGAAKNYENQLEEAFSL